MLVTLDGIVTEVSPLQPENAQLPMLVTLEGIVTDVSSLQQENAYPPMLVTGHPPSVEGIATAPVVDCGIADEYSPPPTLALPSATT